MSFMLPTDDLRLHRALIAGLHDQIAAAAAHYAILPNTVTAELCDEWAGIVRLIRELEHAEALLDRLIARRSQVLWLRRN